jgi:hypothetical protein
MIIASCLGQRYRLRALHVPGKDLVYRHRLVLLAVASGVRRAGPACGRKPPGRVLARRGFQSGADNNVGNGVAAEYLSWC